MRNQRGNTDGHYLSFRLSELTFGINTDNIHEIIGLGDVKWVSRNATTGRDVFTFRGTHLPVVHLGIAFGLRSCDFWGNASVIVIRPDARMRPLIGIFANDVLSVVDIKAGQIDPVPTACQPQTGEFLIGVGKADGKTIALLNTRKVGERFLDGAPDEYGAGATSFARTPALAGAMASVG
jgi:chemotaxis signal transduction protein